MASPFKKTNLSIQQQVLVATSIYGDSLGALYERFKPVVTGMIY
jgi:hypothetical protein